MSLKARFLHLVMLLFHFFPMRFPLHSPIRFGCSLLRHLGLLGAKDAMGTLIGALQDKDEDVRTMSAWALNEVYRAQEVAHNQSSTERGHFRLLIF